ncbi:MAG: asparagine synthase (glutamine-hydrolyzing) [Rhizobiales bacterium]|nr:asparagine synthase (glutamine-hydrolyzing) [Hyphomicrobiales bacterium]
MCGIAGFFRINDKERRPDDGKHVLRQIETMWYRGPDAQKVEIGPGVGLGHARLSIIDLSHGADQPMYSASGQTCVVFNGEIYNFQELRQELEQLGHSFRTQSDTEVIVEGYEAWGTDMINRLRGMFAIALWDKARDMLVLYRDRVGKKPLFYSEQNGTLLFASEPKGILCWPGVRREPDLEAIHEYLTFQYVPSPMSAFKGLKKLPPAHMLVLKRGGTPRVTRYFALPKPTKTYERPMEQLQEELVHLLKESVRLRLISDVPVGAFLSGGVDSSAVVAMMAQASSSQVRTFTIGFEEQQFDERQYARQVAERYGTKHEEFLVRPDAMSIIDDLVYHYNEPFADSSAIPTYYVSKIAREHVTVILNGDGGDESFLGYTRYLSCKGVDQFDRIPHKLARTLQQIACSMPDFLDRYRLPRYARKMATKLYERPSRRYEPAIAFFSDAVKQSLYGPGMKDFLHRSALDRLDPYFDEAPNMLLGAAWADTHNYLPDALMVKVDIASMAHSLEARSPFLDHKLMEWAASIPAHQRFEGSEPKSLLKKAMRSHLPHDLMYRPKMGFGVPIDLWLRGEMKEFTYDTLLSRQAGARGLFDMDHVKSLLDRHVAGENWAYPIWALLMLELWHQMWIDSSDPFTHPAAQRIIARAPDTVSKV